MSIELRAFTDDELEEAFAMATVAFGGGDEATVETERRTLELDRSIAAVDGGRLVATAGAYTFALTVPGGGSVPAAGVTWVAVLPTHRRRGILRQMMAHQLDDILARDEPVAVLTASEGGIYRRFGYGVASERVAIEIDAATARLEPPAAEGGGLELVDRAGGEKVIPELYDRWRRIRPGALTRSSGFWTNLFEDPPGRRGGAGEQFLVVHHGPDGADGYLRYRVKQRWERVASHQVVVEELRGLSPEVEARLWQLTLDIDLATTVAAGNRAVDDPVRWRLSDPRRLSVRSGGDWLWARITDPGRALGARAYSTSGALTIGVIDPFASGPAGGVWRLEVPAGASDGAGPVSCERVGHDVDRADLVVHVADLGSLWLGAVRASVLAAAGRLRASSAAVAQADRMFAVAVAPWCDTPF